MKKRKLAILSFLVVAVLAIGIGYAAVSTELFINGSATFNANTVLDSSVKFSSATVLPSTINSETDNNASSNYSIDSTGDTITLTVGDLDALDDYVTYEIVIENAGDLDATVSVKTNASTQNYIDTVDVGFDNGTTVAAGGTLTITVKVTLVNMPTDAGEHSDTIDITLLAETA